MPSLYLAHLRHAQHYADVAWQAGRDLYAQGGDYALAGLELFDRERSQIETGRAWAHNSAGDVSEDQLITDYTNAVAYFGLLRYDIRGERIPALETALDAARRRGDGQSEGGILGNLGLAYYALGN